MERSVPTNETREAIRIASIELFASKGFEATGIRDIARDVGLTPGAIYHYIGSKEDLLLEILRDGITALTRNANAALAAADDTAAARLTGLVAVHVTTHCEIQLEALVADQELKSLNDANRRRIVKLRDRYERLWKQVLEEGIESGEFVIPQPGVCRLALLQMCTGVVNWYSEDGPLSKDELADAFSELALQMVGARKRRRKASPELVKAAVDGGRSGR